MSQAATEPPVQGTPPESTDPQPQETKAPYADYLEEIPETIRPLVENTFKKWDANVTQRFQELHSQQETWKPVTEQYQPDDVLGALQVAQILEQDPTRFLTAFAEAYPELVKEALSGQGLTPEPTSTPTGAEQGLGDLDPDDPVVKRMQALEEQIASLTGNLTERQEQELATQQQQYLDGILSDLHEKHGDFDDTFILAQLAYRAATPDQAIQAWKEVTSKFGAPIPDPNSTTPPTPIPSNGGVPSTQFSAEDLKDGDTKALVAQLLEQAAQQNQ